MPTWFSNPYAGFSPEALLGALARTRPRAAPGMRVRYSNYGVGLLGELLVRAAHGPGGAYAPLLAERVLDPLGPAHTSCAADQPQATGYWHGRARPGWHMATMTGAGAGRSSARDLLTVLDGLCAPGAVPQDAPGTLRAALTDVTVPRVALPAAGTRIALVWSGASGPARTTTATAIPAAPGASPASRGSVRRRASPSRRWRTRARPCPAASSSGRTWSGGRWPSTAASTGRASRFRVTRVPKGCPASRLRAVDEIIGGCLT
ncbi:beta-lactamase family protein [Streptomyces sp. G44]|uniref:serine hydrolase n=1 Tax=Streptomyces sp. G44 TaxID=2807632 RepID=UPI001960F00C|nr:serine hydrolase domain-containing protein [Streptomyces sp. G44]MBM7170890.1 beta-lactamase family protein [Streptomyces sp. G44]